MEKLHHFFFQGRQCVRKQAMTGTKIIFTINMWEFSFKWLKFIFSVQTQAAFGFGFIRFALEYKKTPARATAVPAVKSSQLACKRRKKDSRESEKLHMHICIS